MNPALANRLTIDIDDQIADFHKNQKTGFYSQDLLDDIECFTENPQYEVDMSAHVELDTYDIAYNQKDRFRFFIYIYESGMDDVDFIDCLSLGYYMFPECTISYSQFCKHEQYWLFGKDNMDTSFKIAQDEKVPDCKVIYHKYPEQIPYALKSENIHRIRWKSDVIK
jgi:hypothetical protein